MKNMILDRYWEKILNDVEAKGCRRVLRPLEGPQGREVLWEGRPVLNMCSNDYLGLAGDARLCAAAREAMDREGWGSGASRLVCGDFSAHRALEKKLAAFKKTEAALIFNSGYAANVGILAGLFGRGDVIFSDRLNHASIIDGIQLSRAEHHRYRHLDMDDLESRLKSVPGGKKRLIVTESVFSMDGDIAPLDHIAALARRYQCGVMVDEAHALGVLGAGGRGAVEHFGLEGQMDIQMGTLSKAVGAAGAYVCGSRALIEALINRARSLIYTTGMPPAQAAAALRGIEAIEAEPARRIRLTEQAAAWRAALRESGWDLLSSATPIIPLMVREEAAALAFSRSLLEQGIFAAAIRPPTVPAGTARLRFTVTAAHTPEDLKRVHAAVDRIGRDLCLL